MIRLSHLEIVPARLIHTGPIAARMRNIGRLECEAMGHSGKKALRNGLAFSDKVWTALVDGKPEALFGVVVTSAIERSGTPWFLGTDRVYHHGRDLVRLGPYFVKECVDSSRNLSNLVSVYNMKALRLLKCWGFTIGEDIILVADIPFKRFWMNG